jgi:hypothetical protein
MSRTLDEHERHLHAVFAKLKEFNICINPRKTYLGFPSIQYLGQKVDALGLSTPVEKIKAVQQLHFPETLKDLESYLGLTGSFRNYIEGYSWKAEPLQSRKTLLLKNSPVSGRMRRNFANSTIYVEPSDAEMEAYNSLQKELSYERFLHHHNPEKQLYVDIDSSKQRGHGVVVYHVADEYIHSNVTKPPSRTAIQPVLFLSRCLTEAEKKYWPTELEIAGLVWAIRKLRQLVNATEIPTIFYTDHSASASIVRQSSLNTTSIEKLNLRLIRASQYIQQFNVRVFHRPGGTNTMADALSRLPAADQPFSHASSSPDAFSIDDIEIGINMTNVEEAYLPNATIVEMTPEFRKKMTDGYQKDTRWSAVLEVLHRDAESKDPRKTRLPYELIDGLLYSKDNDDKDTYKLCIPWSLVGEIFELVHDKSGHQGYDRCYERLYGLKIYKCTKLLKQYIRHCSKCNELRTSRHKPYGSLQPIITPPIPFHTITIDIITNLPTTKDGYDQIMTVTDKFSKRKTFIPGKSNWTAHQWGTALMERLQVGDWGFPRVMISDRDRKFLSDIWKAMFTATRTHLFYTTAYHPQADGQSEKTNETAEIMLRYMFSMYPDTDWTTFLPSIQAILNSSLNSSTQATPHEIMYGIHLNQPSSINATEGTAEQKTQAMRQDFKLRDDAYEALKIASVYMKHRYDSKHMPKYFEVGDMVLLNLHHGYEIPQTGSLGRKLAPKRVGPFKIFQRIGKLAYHLDLPKHYRIHPVVSIAHLEPAAKGHDPFKRPQPDHPPPVSGTSDEYEIDTILDKRTRTVRRKEVTEYLLRWKGYGPEFDSWYAKEDLDNAADLVKNYEERHAGKQQRTRRRNKL